MAIDLFIPRMRIGIQLLLQCIRFFIKFQTIICKHGSLMAHQLIIDILDVLRPLLQLSSIRHQVLFPRFTKQVHLLLNQLHVTAGLLQFLLYIQNEVTLLLYHLEFRIDEAQILLDTFHRRDIFIRILEEETGGSHIIGFRHRGRIVCEQSACLYRTFKEFLLLIVKEYLVLYLVHHFMRQGTDAVHDLKVIQIVRRIFLARILMIVTVLLQYIHDLLTVLVGKRLEYRLE